MTVKLKDCVALDFVQSLRISYSKGEFALGKKHKGKTMVSGYPQIVGYLIG